MKINLKLDSGMHFVATAQNGKQTHFDTIPTHGGADEAPTPMEVLLEALCACGSMDVVSIIRKKRLDITDLQVHATAERADTHPKVITKAHLVFELVSPNAELKDLERAVEMSQQTYCGVAAMFRRSGCEVTYESILRRE